METLNLDPKRPKPAGVKFAVISFLSPLLVMWYVMFSPEPGPMGYQSTWDLFLEHAFFGALIFGPVSTILSYSLREKRGIFKVFGLVLNVLIVLPMLLWLIYLRVLPFASLF